MPAKPQFSSHLYPTLTTEKIVTGIIFVRVREKLRKVHHTSVKTKKYDKQNKPKLPACTKGVDQSLNTD